MSQMVLPDEYHLPFKLNVHDTQLTEEQFLRLCQENPDYRPNQAVEVLDDPPALSEESVLPGFALHVRELW